MTRARNHQTGTVSTPTMRARPLAVDGAFEFTPRSFPDERGRFLSPFQERAFAEATGHRGFPVAQTNHSHSRQGVLRGVHFTATPPGQAKYVYCPYGRSLDIVVDLRTGSPTFGRSDTVLLEPQYFRAVYLPVGVGHAFVALADHTLMTYLVTSSYAPDLELALDPTDPELKLPLPEGPELLMSERDRAAPTLAEAHDHGILPRYADCLALAEELHA